MQIVTYVYQDLYFVFIIYVVTMLNYALFSRESGSRIGIDLNIFSTWGSTMQAHAYFLENIVMFIPIGVLIPPIWKSVDKWWILILIAFLCSLSLETIQLITKRGFFQIDDIMMNTIGGLVVYSVGRLLRNR